MARSGRLLAAAAAATVIAALTATIAHAAVPEDKITSLPLYKGNFTFDQYSGYLNGGGEKRLHYWLVESMRSPSTDPLMLWLNGSLYGKMRELGPFTFNDEDLSDLSLYDNPYAWNVISNVLFVESPVGVGFSYSTNSADYSNNDTGTAADNYRMLQDFFRLYPEYAGREFYIAGESYAGMYVPMLADEIRRGNDRGEPFINLQGFLVGNGVTEPQADSTINSLAPFAYGHGLISQKTWSKIGECNGGATPNDPTCLVGLNELSTAMRGVHRYSIYEPCQNSKNVDWSVLSWGDHINGDIPCVNNDQDTAYFNLPEVKAALHVRDDIRWVICSDSLRYTKNLGSNSYQFYPALVAKYRIIIFAGETDAAVPYVGSETWTRQLGQPLLEDWRAWRVNNQVAGYVTTYENLQFVTFKGGWHTVPESHPAESLHMIERFYLNQPLGK